MSAVDVERDVFPRHNLIPSKPFDRLKPCSIKHADIVYQQETTRDRPGYYLV